jgi:hypothetical protein
MTGSLAFDGASAALEIFVRHPKRTFATISAQKAASADLDQILVRQWSAGELSELAADRERSQIDADEANPVDERRHFSLCCGVVAGIEKHALPAVRPRIVGQDLCAKVVERLYDARAGHEIGKHFARHAAFEIDRLEQWSLDRVVGVNDNAPIPIWKPRQRRRQFCPVDRNEYDVGPRCFLAPSGLDRGGEFANKLFERIRATAVRNDRFDAGASKRPCKSGPDRA